MRQINQCLNKQLHDICRRTVQLDDLTLKITRYLNSPLRDHCKAASFNRGCLVITTTNAWATELRYELPHLRDQLRKNAGIYQLTSIQINVFDANAENNAEKIRKPSLTLSENARKVILQAKATCKYLPLKEALSHLVRD